MSIIIEKLSYVYSKGSPYEKKALDNINLEINDGEFIGIIGHTGSGKSTLIQHLNGLLKPTEGIVTVNDIKTHQKNLKSLRKQVGIVFQYPEHQLFEETVYKDVAFGIHKSGLNVNEIEKKVKKAVATVGLSDDILYKSPFELSGGQKRRAAIAGVLVMEPSVLILDEPAAGLDPSGREEIYDYINNLHNSTGMTIILVSHNMEDIAKLANRVIVMNEGRVEMDGSVSSVFGEVEKLENMGLSIPQITYFMKKIKALIPDLNDELFTVAGAAEELLIKLKCLGGNKC